MAMSEAESMVERVALELALMNSCMVAVPAGDYWVNELSVRQRERYIDHGIIPLTHVRFRGKGQPSFRHEAPRRWTMNESII
jgi:hypothetical protein